MTDTAGDGQELVVTLPITHKYGLHARASTKFVELAQRFRSQVLVARGDALEHEVDGKSVLGVMTLGAEMGHQLRMRIVGADARQAAAALEELVRANFHGV